MKYCPRCQQEWLDRFNFCPEDATALTACLPDPLLGVVLANKFEITARIGSGPHGVVYKARHRFLDEWRAIKFLAHDPSSGAEMTRLTRSLSMAEHLRSEHTVRLLDFDQVDGRYMVVSEFAEGDSLAGILRSQGALPVAAVLTILRQTIVSLAEAHRQGACHLALKPSNILVSGPLYSPKTLSIKVCDYFTSGLPKSYASGNGTCEASSLPALYAAPEQLTCGAGDSRSDIFALGRLAQHLILGDLIPLRPDEERLLCVDLAARQVPEAAGALLRQMLSVAPEDRPKAHDLWTAFSSQVLEAPEAKTSVAYAKATPESALDTPPGELMTAASASTPESIPRVILDSAAPPVKEPPAVSAVPAASEAMESGGITPAQAPRTSWKSSFSKGGAWLRRALPWAVAGILTCGIVIYGPSLLNTVPVKEVLGADFFLVIPLALTGLLLLLYIGWLWWVHRAPRRASHAVVSAAPTPAVSAVPSITLADLPVAAPVPVEPAPVVASASAHVAPAPDPIVMSVSTEPPKEDATLTFEAIPAPPPPVEPVVAVHAEAPPEPSPVVVSGTPMQSPERPAVVPLRFSTLSLTPKEPLLLRMLFWFRPLRSGNSLFNYANPADVRRERFSWSDWVTAFKPDFKAAPTQGSLFHPAESARESELVELSPDILELIARRPQGTMPSMISSIFGDFSEMGQELAGLRRRRTLTGALSIGFHASLAALLMWTFLHKAREPLLDLKKPEVLVTMVAPPPTLFKREEAPRPGGGGGGGGKLEPTPPSHGRIPKTDALQLVPPDPRPRPMASPDAMLAEPTVVVPIEIPQNKALPIGDITAPPDKNPPSSGPGARGGIGTGRGTGVGPGSGSGVGPGSGGGIGGGDGGGVGSGQGPYVSGQNGVRDPVPVRTPRPDYTEAAQRAKIMGQVSLRVLVDRSGQVARVQLLKGLGYGLDESAIKTVQTKWRFQPGTRFGQPIDVWVEVLVGFNML